MIKYLGNPTPPSSQRKIQEAQGVLNAVQSHMDNNLLDSLSCLLSLQLIGQRLRFRTVSVGRWLTPESHMRKGRLSDVGQWISTVTPIGMTGSHSVPSLLRQQARLQAGSEDEHLITLKASDLKSLLDCFTEPILC